MSQESLDDVITFRAGPLKEAVRAVDAVHLGGINVSELARTGLAEMLRRTLTADDRRAIAERQAAGNLSDAAARLLLGNDSEDGAMATSAAGADGRPTDASESPHVAAAQAFRERVRQRLGDAIEDVTLFGPVAHGTATADSDVDILTVIADDAEYATVDDHLLDIAYDVQLEFGVHVEVHSLTAAEFTRRRERGDPFVRAVLEEETASDR